MDIIQNIDYHIVDSCNLNCKHCNHFCPVVPKSQRLKPLGKIMRDISYLYDYRDIFNTLTIIGGEPFIYPEIDKVFDFVRNMFPDKRIQTITNGTLHYRLGTIADSIVNNNIYVTVSLYPVSYREDIRKAFQAAIPDYLLTFDEVSTTNGFSGSLLRESTQGEDFNKILHCPRRHWCTQLRDNRLYICHFAAGLDVLKNHFKDQVKIDENDCYIELGPHTSGEDVLLFLNNYIPDVCRHCDDVNQYSVEDGVYYFNYVPWGKSNMELSEFYRR